jgi:hypothetical protein
VVAACGVAVCVGTVAVVVVVVVGVVVGAWVPLGAASDAIVQSRPSSTSCSASSDGSWPAAVVWMLTSARPRAIETSLISTVGAFTSPRPRCSAPSHGSPIASIFWTSVSLSSWSQISW